MTINVAPSPLDFGGRSGTWEPTSLFEWIKELMPSMGERDSERLRRSLLEVQGLDAYRAILEDLAKRLSAQENWEPLEKVRAMRKWLYRQERLRDLREPLSLEQFEASLRWMCENGDEQELWLLRQVRQQPAFTSEMVDRLFDLADRMMCDRVYEPIRVVRRGEAVYQRHLPDWERQHAGQFIAICGDSIIDHDADRTKLLQRLIDMQKEIGRFRAYVIEVGAPVFHARGPGGKAQLAQPADTGNSAAGVRR